MIIKEINFPQPKALDLDRFKEMDYYAVENYSLPIELMMENAGLQLAKLVSNSVEGFDSKILIGVGNGNNGGGGLVAARRLAAWGYSVSLDIITTIDKELPKRQLERALKFGATEERIDKPDIWVDAYLGFSQRLPLYDDLLDRIAEANRCNCKQISLDIPTGFLGDTSLPFFEAQKVLTLAAPKKILYNLPDNTEMYVADLGIPSTVYQKFGINILPFQEESILKLIL